MKPYSTAKIVLITIFAVVYFFSPIDFLPDFIGPIGRTDDLLIAFFLVYLFFFKPLINDFRYKNNGNSNHKNSKENFSSVEKSFDPYKVLELEKTASQQEIKSAYKKKVSEYHPDKVENLGPELKTLAMEKTIEINKAYEMLK